MKEVLIWLKENHPDVYEEYMAHTKPQRDLEAKRLKAKFDAIQKWLDELKDPQNDLQKAIQVSLNIYNMTDDEEERANMWNVVRALGSSHPSFPRRGIRSEEE